MISDGVLGISERAREYPFIWEVYSGTEIFPNEGKRILDVTEDENALYADISHINIILRQGDEVVYETNYTAGDMTSQEWEEMMDFIGEGDVTILCYDNPTCFFANILGMRVEEQGGVFRGYYLVMA